jgi:hypothetical protein
MRLFFKTTLPRRGGGFISEIMGINRGRRNGIYRERFLLGSYAQSLDSSLHDFAVFHSTNQPSSGAKFFLITFDAVLNRFRRLIEVVLWFLYETPVQKIHCNDFVVIIHSTPLHT